MKKLFLLLSVIALASCSSDDVDNCKLQQSVSAANYKVDAKDIKMVIADYFSLFGTRSGGSDYNVLHIDTIGKFASAATRSSKEDTDPLLYAVKISDGSTIIVGGDKRAESIYARFNNVDLKIDENGQFTNDSIPDMVYYLIEDYMADVKNKIKTMLLSTASIVIVKISLLREPQKMMKKCHPNYHIDFLMRIITMRKTTTIIYSHHKM